MRNVALALALLFVADVAIDTLDVNCVQVESCHACLCQTHFLSPAAASGGIIAAPEQSFLAPKFDPFADRLMVETILRPPIGLA